MIGSAATTSFLQKYETAMGFTTEVAGTGSTPKPFYKRVIAQGELATGEIAVENISAPTAFFIYADDCAVECPSISFNAPDDGFHRRGYFPGAAMTINHDYNEGLLDTNGGFAYWDLGHPSPGPTPYPVTIDRCATPLPGTSKIDNRGVDLNGWYGVPITITGTSKFMDQYWYLNPQFPAPFSASLWVNGFTDPATGLAVMPGTYTVPFPQPAVSPWVGDTDHAIALGFSKISAARSIVYVPSGGDFWPARFYYLDPVH